MELRRDVGLRAVQRGRVGGDPVFYNARRIGQPPSSSQRWALAHSHRAALGHRLVLAGHLVLHRLALVGHL